MATTPFEPTGNGVRVRIKVEPRSAANRIRNVVVDENHVARLQVSVTAVPEDGRANKAVAKLLGKAWKVPPSAIEVVSGAADRRKTLLVRGEPAALIDRLSVWLRNIGCDRKARNAGKG